jgi:hypothetical protein
LFALPAIEWTLAPNPADQSIRLNSPVGISAWTLMDVQGRSLAGGYETEISSAQLPNGIYLLQAWGLQGQPLVIKRLMVVHP